MMPMKCTECNSTSNSYDERLGETVCAECGLVLVSEMFEETVHILDKVGDNIHSADKGHLGSVITGKGSFRLNRYNKTTNHITVGITYCNMVLSNLSPSPALKERVGVIYRELYLNMKAFTRYTYENRATAIVYYALRENGTPAEMKEVCQEFEVQPKLVKKILRKINSHFGNRINQVPVSPTYYLNRLLGKVTKDLSFHRQCNEVLALFESLIGSDYNKSKAYYASICWITTNLYCRVEFTRTKLAKDAGFDEKCLYLQTKSLLGLIGFSKVKEIQGIEINKLI